MLLPAPSAVTHSRAPCRRPRRWVGGAGALRLCLAGALAAGTACGRSRAPDAGGDTALARDLAIVQMETNRARDSAADALARAAATPQAPADSTLDSILDSAVDSAALPPAVPVDTPVTQVAHVPAAVAHTAAHAAHAPADPCDSPDRASQTRCLRRKLAAYDAPLNRVYERYIARLRAAPASRGGGEAAVRKLRVSQRAWLVYRDRMCQLRLARNEPKRWAPGRAACLGEYAAARTKLLSDMLAGKR